jgi:hypothetical protein
MSTHHLAALVLLGFLALPGSPQDTIPLRGADARFSPDGNALYIVDIGPID